VVSAGVPAEEPLQDVVSAGVPAEVLPLFYDFMPLFFLLFSPFLHGCFLIENQNPLVVIQYVTVEAPYISYPLTLVKLLLLYVEMEVLVRVGVW